MNFPLLTKDDIELRIGQLSKDGTKASLLLYQDARCGMKYLDQVVGAANWQKKYYEVRGLVICSLGIFDKEKQQWVWKDDTGTAGTIEEEKSVISDSFKRCCVCFGLARELYTAPDIWVKIESKYDKFKVKSISYNQNREIVSLQIVNEKGELVYSYGHTSQTNIKSNTEPKQNNDKLAIRTYLLTASNEQTEAFNQWLFMNYGCTDHNELTDAQASVVVRKLKEKGRI